MPTYPLKVVVVKVEVALKVLFPVNVWLLARYASDEVPDKELIARPVIVEFVKLTEPFWTESVPPVADPKLRVTMVEVEMVVVARVVVPVKVVIPLNVLLLPVKEVFVAKAKAPLLNWSAGVPVTVVGVV